MADLSTKIISDSAWNPYRTLVQQMDQDYPDEVCEDVAEDDLSDKLIAAAGAVSGIFIAAYFGTDLFRLIRDRIRVGRTTERYDKAIAKRIKEEPSYDVAGSSDLAREAWRKTIRKFPFPAIMIDAPDGEGMDALVEKMIVMKEKGDPAVPKRFLDAPVIKFDPMRFRAETMYRGDAAKAVTGIARRARKGPIIVYIPDFDAMISEHTSREGIERTLFHIMEEPSIRKNLIVIGTTSRKDKILEKYPDLNKRFNWIDIRKFDVPTSIVAEMSRHPEYSALMSWERAEYAKAIDGIMNELKVFGELGRFYDVAEKRFLEGKFEVLAEASRKGGRVTMADITKAAEAVERTNPKAAKDAKDTAAKFAKEMAKKK